MASNLIELDPERDDLTSSMDVDVAATAKQNATRRKGRGFESDSAREDTVSKGRFEAIGSDMAGTGSSAQKSVEGWIVLVTGIHEEASEDDIKEKFSDFGELKNLHLNLDRRSGFVKGYALVEYNTFKEAKAAVDGTNGTELLGQIISTDFAFVTGPKGDNSRKR